MKAEVATGEKRGEQRFPLGVSFTGQELSRTQKVSIADKTVAGVVHNISKTGIGVSTPASLAYSSVVRCDVAIKNLPVSIPTMAQVRWVKRVHAGEYRSGLAFLF